MIATCAAADATTCSSFGTATITTRGAEPTGRALHATLVPSAHNSPAWTCGAPSCTREVTTRRRASASDAPASVMQYDILGPAAMHAILRWTSSSLKYVHRDAATVSICDVALEMLWSRRVDEHPLQRSSGTNAVRTVYVVHPCMCVIRASMARFLSRSIAANRRASW